MHSRCPEWQARLSRSRDAYATGLAYIGSPITIYDAGPWWASSAYDSENNDAGVDCHYPITIGNDLCVRRAERFRGGLG